MAHDISSSRMGLAPAFDCTRWSLVIALRERPGDNRQPLAELTANYGYPVYAYLRWRGFARDIASRLLQSFFSFLAQEVESTELAVCGRFRDFLFERLQAFVADQHEVSWSELRDTSGVDFDNLERRLQSEHSRSSNPETVFTRSFALQVLLRARTQLRQETQRSNRQDMFDLLEPSLTREPDAESIQRLATTLGISTLAVQVAIKRLRQRFRQLAEAELQETVSNPADLEMERIALFSILARPE